MAELPITDFKEALLFGVALAMFVDDDLGDGLDIPEDIFAATQLFNPGSLAWDGKENIIPQYLDMDSEELADIKDALRELDLRDDRLEQIIEKVSGHVLDIGQNIKGIILAIKENQNEETPGQDKRKISSPVRKYLELKDA